MAEMIHIAQKFGADSGYQKFGFRKIGRIKNYYGDGEDALTMGGKI